MTIRDLMNTDCMDIDEILLVSSGSKVKKKKDVRPLAQLGKDMGKE